MKKQTLSLLVMLLFAACGQPTAPDVNAQEEQPAETGQTERPAVVAPENATLKLVVAPPTAEFPQAVLTLDEMIPNEQTMEVAYTFGVEGFELTAQTPDAPERGCANSPDGQHIHFILNNKPYLAEYSANFTAPADPGHNVVLAFLSRSYHESLKNTEAMVLKEFDMPGQGERDLKADYSTAPTLFYSRPKGDYTKFDNEKMLLDFYLLNTDLEDHGYSVRATIDGETWIINKWDSYFIEGLQLGQHTVRLELIDKDGNLVPGPFNDSGERTFNYLAS